MQTAFELSVDSVGKWSGEKTRSGIRRHRGRLDEQWPVPQPVAVRLGKEMGAG